MNKNNVPYYIAGTLAAFTLLASGVFAAAPYIGFLAPVAALSVGLPFIIGCAVFSVVTIALSAVVIQKNGAIRRQGALLGEETKKNAELILELQEKEAEISGMQKQLANQAKEIEGKDTQLADEKSKVEAKEKTISELKAKIRAQEQTISEQNDQLTKKEAEVKAKEEENSEQKTQLAEKNKKIEEDKLKVAIADGTVQLAKGTVNGAVWFAKGAVNGVLYSGKYAYDNYVPSTESAKEKLSNAFDAVGNSLRNTYSVMPSVEFAKDIKTASQKAFASVNEAYSSGRVPGIVKRGLTDVYYPPIESAKGTISSVGDKLKNVYDTMPSAESARNWVPSLKTAGWIAGGAGLVGTTYITVNGGFTVDDNSSNAVSNPVNSVRNHALSSNLLFTCPHSTYQQVMQSKIDEASKILADSKKFAENNFGISEEDNTNNKNEPQSMVSKILSIPRNLWGSISNFISGSNKDAHNHSEPQWSKNLHKSQDLEEIIDGGTLDNLFSPRNGINTSRQQSTLMDSVDLTKLTREVHPSAYSNSLPGGF